MANKVNIADLINLETGIGKVYVALKDGKRKSLKAVLTMLRKSGKKDPWGAIFSLRRLFAANTGRMVLVDREAETIQIVNKPTTKKAKKAAAKKEEATAA